MFQASRAHLSPNISVYPDAENTAQTLLETATTGSVPFEVTDSLDVTHRMWPVSDIDLLGRVVTAMAGRAMFIADGHHRYETGLLYREQLIADNGGELPANHPANYIMMMCVSMTDPGMVLPGE